VQGFRVQGAKISGVWGVSKQRRGVIRYEIERRLLYHHSMQQHLV
jgi:hypothetical protein